MGLAANSFDDEPYNKYNVLFYSICKTFEENSMKINSNTNFKFWDYAKLLQVVSNAPVKFQNLIDEESHLFICEQSYSSVTAACPFPALRLDKFYAALICCIVLWTVTKQFLVFVFKGLYL